MKDYTDYIPIQSNLRWYQRIRLLISYYTYDFKRKYSNREILVADDGITKYYIKFCGRNHILLHTKKQIKGGLFKKYKNSYEIC